MSHLHAEPGVGPSRGDETPAPTHVAIATPADVPGPYEPDAPFWMPRLSESLRLLGWRWVYVIGLALGAGLLVWLVFFRGRFFALTLSGLIIKLATFLVGGAISLAVYLRRGVVSLRKDPFCIHCGYSLTGLGDGCRCPECGRLCSFRVSQEYKRDPHWFRERYRTRAHTAPTGAVLEVPRTKQDPVTPASGPAGSGAHKPAGPEARTTPGG